MPASRWNVMCAVLVYLFPFYRRYAHVLGSVVESVRRCTEAVASLF